MGSEEPDAPIGNKSTATKGSSHFSLWNINASGLGNKASLFTFQAPAICAVQETHLTTYGQDKFAGSLRAATRRAQHGGCQNLQDGKGHRGTSTSGEYPDQGDSGRANGSQGCGQGGADGEGFLCIGTAEASGGADAATHPTGESLERDPAATGVANHDEGEHMMGGFEDITYPLGKKLLGIGTSLYFGFVDTKNIRSYKQRLPGSLRKQQQTG